MVIHWPWDLGAIAQLESYLITLPIAEHSKEYGTGFSQTKVDTHSFSLG